MIESYLKLATTIHEELTNLEKTYSRIQRAKKNLTLLSTEQDLFLDAIALGLHDFYTGVERILTKIAKTIDNSLPSEKNWHQQLLQQMAVEKIDLRPAVISLAIKEELDELRRFRHVVRSVYAFELDQARIEQLIDKLERIWNDLQQELQEFALLIEKIAVIDS